MARKTKSGRHQLNLYEELKDIFDEIGKEFTIQKEIGLNKGADYLIDCLEANTPIQNIPGGGITKIKWSRSTEYKSVRYLYNTALRTDAERGDVVGDRIPIVNVLEFAPKGKPFVRKTFEKEKDKIVNIIVEELKK